VAQGLATGNGDPISRVGAAAIVGLWLALTAMPWISFGQRWFWPSTLD